MPAGAVDNDSRVSRTTLRVIAICWVTIIFDGYDLIVYGAVVPDLLEYQQWSLSPEEAGTIGSYALFGMLVGALIAGTITDLVGRRKIILFCITWFSLAMGLCAIAPSPELFGFFRFLAGLGLGGVVPTASAITIEYAPPARRKFLYALMFSGYSVGGILAATLAIFVVPAAGFRAMFAIGLAPLVLILPLAWKFLPESISFLHARGRRQEAEELARRYDIPMPAMEATTAVAQRGKLAPLASLFSRDYRVATGTFWAICFLMLLLVYGLNTWLAQLMKDAGYPLGSSLAFLATLNLGAIVVHRFATLAPGSSTLAWFARVRDATEEVYDLAKRRGMDFVTITDHDTIDGCLELADRPDCFVSEELTARFAGEPQAVHVLCYGITPGDHQWLQAHAGDVEACAAYIQEHEIACALAHPFYDVAAPLTPRHRRRLAELFPIWEVRNGSRARGAQHACRDLRRDARQHRVGGSDDHAGVDIGRT